MARTAAYLILLATLPAHVAGAATLGGYVLTRIKPSSCTEAIQNPPAGKTSFLATDTEFYLWFYFNDVKAQDVAESVWYRPDGSMDKGMSGAWTKMEADYSQVCYTDRAFKMTGADPPLMMGEWTVKVNFNSVEAFSIKFAITPGISSVTHGTTFEPGVPDGGWVTVFGAGFGGTERVWAEGDFAGGKLPTQLDGIGVEINGNPAYVYFISPGQLNVLAPMEEVSSDVTVRVTTPQGDSNTVTARRRRLSPGLFLFSAEGSRYVAAQHLNWSLVGKTTLYPDATTPAQPNEWIHLYGTGFGQTNPPLVNGLPPAYEPLAGQVHITVGGRPAEVKWAGMSAAGQCQFDIVIPADLPDGDHEVVAVIEGVRTPPGAFITVQR